MRRIAVVLLGSIALTMALEADRRPRTDAYAMEAEAAPVNAGNTICPVCGTKLDQSHALTAECSGRCYYTCSLVCENEFRRNPEHYAANINT